MLITIDPVNVPLPDPVIRTSDSVEFTISRLMPSSPDLVSQIRFTASERMNGMSLTCDGFTTESVTGSVLLQVLRGRCQTTE